MRDAAEHVDAGAGSESAGLAPLAQLGQLGQRTARLLLAEDDREVRRLLAYALRKDGYQIIEAASGSELRTYLGSSVARVQGYELPDLVVTDLRMPGKTGLEILAWMRDLGCAIPVILVTAFGDPETHAEARRLGAVAVLDKPFDIGALRAEVSAAFARAPAAAAP